MLLFEDGLILSQARLREVGVLAAYVMSLGDRREVRNERDFELTIGNWNAFSGLLKAKRVMKLPLFWEFPEIPQ